MVTLQTIVAREVKPGEVAVVTVGYIQAGTKNNIIPDHAELGITVRSYKPDVRKQVLAAIERITKAEANAAGATQEPKIEHYEATDAVYNDPALAQRLQGVLESALGKDQRGGRRPGNGFGGFFFFHGPGCAVVLLQPGWSGSRRSMPKRKRRGRTCLPITHRCLHRMQIPHCTRELKPKWRCCGIC